MAKKNLYEVLKNCETEEEVKSEFARFFKFKISTKDRIDHYTPEILYEFKFNMDLSKLKQRAKCVAQTLYYIRFLKYGSSTRVIPSHIAIIDKNEALFVETKAFAKIYSNDIKYDWDRQPSNPCPKLIEDVAKSKEVINAYVYRFAVHEDMENFLEKRANLMSSQLTLFDNEKKVINEDNFMDVFALWNDLFCAYVKNGHKPSEYFLTDMQEGKAFKKDADSNRVYFELSDGTATIKTVPIKEYDVFWSTYERTTDQKVIYSIRQKMDRLTEDYHRRFTGEFFTPIDFATKALQYIERTIGKKWWESGEYRLWDMSAGTGNLEFNLPSSALQYCYISTLAEDDANYCKRIFPAATCFQYDYLNDDVLPLANPLLQSLPRKMPKKLVDDLNDPNIKWIILINPPFATSNSMGNTIGKVSKDAVSMTAIRQMMTAENLGEVSRELFSQFLFRISKEFHGKVATLGLFSTLKYINANNDQKLRDTVFRYAFKRGFIFSSSNFNGSKGSFPVGFLVWDLSQQKQLEDQKINVDVFDAYAYKYGTKHIPSRERGLFLNNWFERIKNTEIRPPFTGALNLSKRTVDVRDKVADGFICSLMTKGNDVQNCNNTALLSGPYASAGATSVVPSNFEKTMVVHAVRKLIKPDWTNNRDQFMQPNKPLPDSFVNDCIVWTAFSDSNCTVSMKDVEYNDVIYQIHNQMYPYMLRDVKNWKCGLGDIAAQILSENEDRFLAKYLNAHALSADAQKVYNMGKRVYKDFYGSVADTNWLDYKIGLWDVGWYQVKNVLIETGDKNDSLKTLKEAHKALGIKILPQIYEYGFLPPSVKEL